MSDEAKRIIKVLGSEPPTRAEFLAACEQARDAWTWWQAACEDASAYDALFFDDEEQQAHVTRQRAWADLDDIRREALEAREVLTDVGERVDAFGKLPSGISEAQAQDFVALRNRNEAILLSTAVLVVMLGGVQ